MNKLHRASKEAFAASNALKDYVMGLDDEGRDFFLLHMFKPLWHLYAIPVMNEHGTFMAFVMNPDNAAMFWAWVFDKHRAAFLCTIAMIDPMPKWSVR